MENNSDGLDNMCENKNKEKLDNKKLNKTLDTCNFKKK